MKPNAHSFLTSLSSELTARSNRIRYLIGDAHWASDGYHNENVVRDFLHRYSPKSIDVARGFIRSVRPNGEPLISPEIDILLTEVLDHVPLFSEGGLRVVEPDAVRAYFEVKSTFSRTQLREALQHIHKVQSTLLNDNIRRRVWRCIFFNHPGNLGSPEKAIFDEVKKIGQNRKPRDIHLPNCVVLNESSATFLSPHNESVLVRYFETKDLSLACALADIMSALRDDSKGLPETDLQQLIQRLQVPDPVKCYL